MKKHYKFEIDCANCAAKVEDAIKKIDGVNNAHGELHDPEADAGRR